MPESKDFAALPTNLALTLWDVAPLFISIEAAFAILTIALFSGSLRVTIWRLRKVVSPGGVAILTLTSVPLALIYAITALGAAFAVSRLDAFAGSSDIEPDVRDTPQSPVKALTGHIGDLLGPMLIAAAVAAFIKVVLDPNTDWPGLIWVLLALPTAIVLPGGPGAAAIAAGGFSFSPGGIPAAAALVVASTVAALIRSSREPGVASAGEPAET